MSGSLSTLGLGAIGASTLSELGGIAGLAGSALGTILTTASFRGVTFFMPDVREAAGRRVVRWLFPGRDIQRFQDFGRIEGPIQVTGIIVGDDYVIRARRLRTAFLTPGPATLVHPWYGRLRVRLAEQPPEIVFSDREIRVARFTAAFYRDPDTSSASGLFASITDTLTNLLTQADALVDQGIIATQAILSPLVIPIALAGAVSSLLSQAHGVWDGLLGSAPQPVQDAASAAQLSLASGISAPAMNSDTTYADSVSTAFASVPAAIASVAMPTNTAAIAPASQVADGVTVIVSASDVVTLLLQGALAIGTAAVTLSDTSQVPASMLGLGVVARMMIVSQTIAASTGVAYVSQPDAMSARDALIDAIDALAVDLENAAAAGAPLPMSAMWSALRDLRLAVLADFSTTIGRLPAVIDISIARPMSAWAIAYAVAGDTPENVQMVMDDMVTRNDLIHPGIAGPGDIALLELDK